MRHVLIAALLLLSAVGWCADLPDDPTLDKPVTIAVRGEALSDIMPMLEKQTGARLRVSKEISDQKATILVDDKPLREVMTGLSKLFGYFWAPREYSTGRIYEIWQDEKSRQTLSGQRQKALAAALATALQDIEFKAKVTAMSPQERETLKTELSQGSGKGNPQSNIRLEAINQIAKDPLQGICARILADLPANCRSMLRPDVSVRFDARSKEAEWALSESTRKAIAELLNSSGPSYVFGGVAPPETPAADVESGTVRVNLSIKVQGMMLQILATVSGSSAPVEGNMMLPRIRAVPLAMQAIGAQMDPAKLPGGGDTKTISAKAGITAADLSTEAERYQQGTLGGYVNRSDILAILHRKLGLQVISDHYSYFTKWPIPEEASVLDILNGFAPTDPIRMRALQSADWGYDGEFVYMRVRDIQSADATEVPNAPVRNWASVNSEKGCLGLDEQADIATLSADQVLNLRMFGTYLGIGDRIAFGMPTLRLYGMLTPDQRQEALAQGTSIDTFTPEQRKALMQIFFQPGSSFFFSTSPTDSAPVGIWTTEAPSTRLDKPGNSLDNPQTPESPVMVAVREGEPQFGTNARVALPGGTAFRSGSVVMHGTSGNTSASSSYGLLDNTSYTMTFTFADGHTQQMGFNIPKAKSAEKPVNVDAK